MEKNIQYICSNIYKCLANTFSPLPFMLARQLHEQYVLWSIGYGCYTWWEYEALFVGGESYTQLCHWYTVGQLDKEEFNKRFNKFDECKFENKEWNFSSKKRNYAKKSAYGKKAEVNKWRKAGSYEVVHRKKRLIWKFASRRI